jgi:hypothetical protein
MKLNKFILNISAVVMLSLSVTANATIIIVDNTDAGFSSVGFIDSSAASGFGGSYKIDQTGSQGDYAIWDASDNAGWLAGIWQVEMFWRAHPNRALNTFVNIGSGLDTVYINQTGTGEAWHDLGQFTFANSGSFVYMDDSNSASGNYLVADAVRFTFIAPSPSVAVPEPSTILAMALSLFGLGIARRKRD